MAAQGNDKLVASRLGIIGSITVDNIKDYITKNFSSNSKGHLDFTGRMYFYTDGRWIGASTNYGNATENYSQSHGTKEEPSVIWNDLGIGFLPKGTILHRMEFIGRCNATDIQEISVQLSIQGDGDVLDTTGYDSVAEANNEVILPPTVLPLSAPNWADHQRHIVDLKDYVMERDAFIIFCCRPEKFSHRTTRYWIARRMLHYTLPY